MTIDIGSIAFFHITILIGLFTAVIWLCYDRRILVTKIRDMHREACALAALHNEAKWELIKNAEGPQTIIRCGGSLEIMRGDTVGIAPSSGDGENTATSGGVS